MPAEIIGISSYTYYQFSSRDDFKAVAICSGSSGKSVYIYFVGGSSTLQPAAKDGNSYYLYYRYTDMPVMIDMLRNEAPITLIYVPEGSNNTRISTSAEPVGEGELR